MKSQAISQFAPFCLKLAQLVSSELICQTEHRQ